MNTDYLYSLAKQETVGMPHLEVFVLVLRVSVWCGAQ